MIAAFGVGVLWMFVLGLQMRLLARKDPSRASVFVITFVASVIYTYVVRQVNIADDFVLGYAVGTAVGAVGCTLDWGKVVRWRR